MKGPYFLILLATVPLEKVDPENPTEHALDRWKAAHVEALKKRGATEVQIRDITFWDSPAGSAVVTERTTSGKTCTEGMRELTLSWKKGDDQATVDYERLMGEDCCDLDHCPVRTAGGWMTHLRRVCAEEEGQGPRLAALVDRKRGISVHSNTRDADQTFRWKRADADSLCNLSIAKFTCEEESPGARRFTCNTTYPHETYDFSWRRANGVAYIESISAILED